MTISSTLLAIALEATTPQQVGKEPQTVQQILLTITTAATYPLNRPYTCCGYLMAAQLSVLVPKLRATTVIATATVAEEKL